MVHPLTESLAGPRVVAWAVGCVSQYRENRAGTASAGQMQDKLRSGPRFALQGEPATHGFCQSAGHREPQASPFVGATAAAVRLDERLEDGRLQLGGDADAAVAHHYGGRPTGAGVGTQVTDASFIGELHGVRHELPKHAKQSGGIEQ